MNSEAEISRKARFDKIRYAQCWEDADILLEALDIEPGHTCLSIASAGDNTLALAGAGAGRVIAVDLNPAQIACLELRIAAYRTLDYEEFLQFVGQTARGNREALYRRCRGHLSATGVTFWDRRRRLIRRGFARTGRFERFLGVFRRCLLPMVQGRANVRTLFSLESETERREFYESRWNNLRWKLAGRLFFARGSLGRFGRHPAFTRFADESVWSSLERRLPEALVEQSPRDNPYLQWILKGRYETALPWAWRAENFERIRNNLDAIEWRCEPLEKVVDELPPGALNGCNLSDIFEYMSPESYRSLLYKLVRAGAPGCRLVYWNVVVERSRPAMFARYLVPLKQLASSLHRADKAFFYRSLVIEEVV
jgi:S-adenosylmethionine-diacylglycerol 3-amino-3-carboxypropyl transferase